MDRERDGYVVIIPSRNRYLELLRAARSALAQTVAPAEVFIVDDASTDPRYGWIEEVLDDPRITVIRRAWWSRTECRATFAVGAVRNTALAVIEKQRRPAWIAFLDDDDEWMPEKMERQLLVARADEVGLVCCNAWNRDSAGEILGIHHVISPGAKMQAWDIDDELLRWNHVINSTAVISAEIAALLGPQLADDFGEDWEYWRRASEISRVLFLNETLAYYSVGNSKEYSL